MNLQPRTAGDIRGPNHPLTQQVLTRLVSRHGTIAPVAEHRLSANGEVMLGSITVGPGGAKLEAIQPLHILPGHSQATDPRADKYQLGPASDGQVEILFLRYGDVITSPDAAGSLECVHRASEVQVNSSAAEHALDEVPGKNDGVEEEPFEVETEDEAATVTEVPVTQTMTQPSKSQPSATPHLPRDRSDVVQETPTTTRIGGADGSKHAASKDGQRVASMPRDPITVTETFSTARTNYSPESVVQDSVRAEATTHRSRPNGSPEVRISGHRLRKRTNTDQSPESETEEAPGGRSVKRVKKSTSIKSDGDGFGEASPLDVITADPSRTTYSAKGKRRSKIAPEETPTKSAKSSQRSGTGVAVAYEGAPPRVATSNSAIKEGSPTVKFLRKHGGTFLSSIGDKCNVLCVRDGGLAKTMKVFQAIALGIPIVTDKWLFDSAKADGFLDLSTYKPAVAQQEEEWGFSLEKVWGVAQAPFKGRCIYFTPALKKTYTNFSEMEQVCRSVGAEVAIKRPNKSAKLIVLAMEEDDPDAEKMVQNGETCYHKDLVTTSILRGQLDLDDDEFKIKTKHAGGSRRKGPRKST